MLLNSQPGGFYRDCLPPLIQGFTTRRLALSKTSLLHPELSRTKAYPEDPSRFAYATS